MKTFFISLGIFWLIFGGLILSNRYVSKQQCREIIQDGYAYSINGVMNKMHAKCAEADEECLRPLSELDPKACKKITAQQLITVKEDQYDTWIEDMTGLPQ